MIRLSRIPGAALLAAAAMILFAAPSCDESDGACAADPVGAVNAYRATPEAMTHLDLEGPVLSLSPVDANGMQELVVRDAASGVSDTLRYGMWGHAEQVVPLPVVAGRSYRIRLDHTGGFPETCGLLIEDERGVLFAAASDRAPGATAFLDGIPGIAVALRPAGCLSRPADRCFSYLRNMRLEVARGNDIVSLFHGEEATLGDLRVNCLTAQEAGYTGECADAGVTNLSYVIARADSLQ